MVETPEVKHEPISASADSKRNAQYVMCPVAEASKAYATCLHIIANKEGEYVKTQYPACVEAIDRGNCRSSAMREEELGKGRAIYFVERERFGRPATDSGQAIEQLMSYIKPKVKKPREEKQSPVTKKISVPVIAGSSPCSDPPVPQYDFALIPIPGETPLQMARRLLAQQRQEKE